jgi:hypothetical protein
MRNALLLLAAKKLKRGDYYMAKGKKTDNETIYQIMLSYITTNNYSETARLLEMPESTVREIIDKNKGKPEFAKLCEEKKEEFVEKANKIIDKATTLLDRRITMALDRQDELDSLLDVVYEAEEDGKKLSPKQQIAIVKKLYKIELNGLSEITTAIGTMYDKRALAKGQFTSNINNTINLNDEDRQLINNVAKRVQ